MRIALVLFIYCLETATATATPTRLEDAVDLTWSFGNDSIYWPNTERFVFTKKLAKVRQDGSWYASNEFCAGEHGGTHFDAPYHFNKHGLKVGEVPLSSLIVSGIMVDLSKETEELKDKTRLEEKHLEEWVHEHGPIPENSVLLVKFGWSQYYHDQTKYLGIDANNMKFPGISLKAAEWIVRSKNIVGVGVDTASVDPGEQFHFHAHRILSAHQIYVLENVNIPPDFPEKNFILYVLPMKIMEGTGAPLRLVAVPSSLSSFPFNVAPTKIPLYGYLTVIISSIVLLLLYPPNILE